MSYGKPIVVRLSMNYHQTMIAIIASFALSILFSFIVMKLNLTTGIIPSLNVSAGLLGFCFVKTWAKFLEGSGRLKQPFTSQKNTVIQTCVVASSGIAFSGTFFHSMPFLTLSLVIRIIFLKWLS